MDQPSGSSTSTMEFQASESSNGAEQVMPAIQPKRIVAELDTSWLPPGWVVEGKVRSSDATAGSVDRYYYDPVSISVKGGFIFSRNRKHSQEENPDADPAF